MHMRNTPSDQWKSRCRAQVQKKASKLDSRTECEPFTERIYFLDRLCTVTLLISMHASPSTFFQAAVFPTQQTSPLRFPSRIRTNFHSFASVFRLTSLTVLFAFFMQISAILFPESNLHKRHRVGFVFFILLDVLGK